MQCAVCKSNFASETGLNAHVNDTHRSMGFVDIGNQFTAMKLPIPESVSKHLQAAIKCNTCGLSFAHTQSLNRHMKSIHELKPSIICDNCAHTFTRLADLHRHVETVH